MTKIMDYEKLYKEALERAKIAYKDEDRHLKATLERIFPVLKESEDEKTRKEIIEFIKDELHKIEMVTDAGWEEDEEDTKQREWFNKAIDWFEKQKKVDQKFNIGDTVCRKFYEDHTIKRIYYDCNDPVYVCKNEEGLESHIPFSEQDEWELKETANVKATKDTPNKAEELIRYLPYCEDISSDTKKRWIDYLKSVNESWKPTNDQLYILNWVANTLLTQDGIVEREASKVLNEIHEELKKL